eukprot:gnl/TRDRNA2_/TRDRNA2_199675_c0_seq1.p1 gnl/TRDRNA2_/TRDRNA2_199675_c0~~gnl/TRDRNA2_/TRDRNA2_199675_c0_seq1.p1  ORF type:complete len:258 (-),score=56.31 gnl/TRDRNA2_/TRDRNA2_199675_c0_seq1:98-871(-)
MGIVLALPVGLAVVGFISVVAASPVMIFVAAMGIMLPPMISSLFGGAKEVARHTPLIRVFVPDDPMKIEAQQNEALQITAQIEAEIAEAEDQARRVPQLAEDAHQRLLEAEEAVRRMQVAVADAEALAKTTGGWRAVCDTREALKLAENNAAQAAAHAASLNLAAPRDVCIGAAGSGGPPSCLAPDEKEVRSANKAATACSWRDPTRLPAMLPRAAVATLPDCVAPAALTRVGLQQPAIRSAGPRHALRLLRAFRCM